MNQNYDLLAQVARLSDRDLDIRIGEALDYRWVTLPFAGEANLLPPRHYEAWIVPSIPVLYRDGKHGTVNVEGDKDMDTWPALPRFSQDVAQAFRAAEDLLFFEQGYVLARATPARGGQWRIDLCRDGRLLPRVTHASLARALCEALAFHHLLPLDGEG